MLRIVSSRAVSLRGVLAVALALGALEISSAAHAANCPGNPGALGTSRIMTIDPADYERIGTLQYPKTLPLKDREVVLTFDDGPMPPYTNRVLEVLAADCVKANYFVIGRMARGYPDLVRRIQAEGHIVGTHSENHPLAFNKMPIAEVRKEVDSGIASTAAALRDPDAVAPFFRIPGLLRADGVEGYLRSRRMTVWSADIAGDDWKHLTAGDVVRRIMARLNEKGKGIILLHDIQPATALALPELLRQLRKGGYKIVQVAPAARAPLIASAPAPKATAVSEPPRDVPRLPPFARAAPEPAKPAPPAAIMQPTPSAAVATVHPPAVELQRAAPQIATPIERAPPPEPAPAIVAEQNVASQAQPSPLESATPAPKASSVMPSQPDGLDARPFTTGLKPSQSIEIEAAKRLVVPSAPWSRASIHPAPAQVMTPAPDILALSVPLPRMSTAPQNDPAPASR